jgi:hypothetical protein
VVVHADDAGHDCVPAEIENRRAVTRWFVGAVGDRRDLSVLDRNILVGARRRARSVDQLNVLEDDARRYQADEFAHLWPERVGALRVSGAKTEDECETEGGQVDGSTGGRETDGGQSGAPEVWSRAG